MKIHYEIDSDQIVTLSLDQAGPVNLLCAELFPALEDVLNRLEKEGELSGVILTSAKKDFVAGADLDLLFEIESEAAAFEMAENFKALLRRFETLGCPTVAALNGTALGGGFELALGCHQRIALNNPKIRFGLPEVTLGLLPGGGGTQRLIRMLGIKNALPVMLEGRRYDPQTALDMGLVDQLAESPEDMLAKAKTWIKEHPKHQPAWDRKDFQWPGGKSTLPENVQLWSIAPAMLRKRTWGNYPAPRYIQACAYEGSLVDFDTGSRIESRYFAKTAVSPEAKSMISAFWYQLNEVNGGRSRPKDVPPSRVSRVGVLGAGLMGHGIAYASAAAGIDVVLKDRDAEAAAAGKARVEAILKKSTARGRLTEAAAGEILERIQPTGTAEDLRDCDLIVEAVFENRELKAKVTSEAEQYMDPTGVFGTNTSTLPITGLAKASSRPEQFIGLHFFSPVDKMKLVEIIVGRETSPETLARAFDYVLQIRKTPIVVNDSRGFYTSRVFKTYVLEGMTLLTEGQHPRRIESAGLQAGMPVGPLALTDEVSLELVLQIMEQTRSDLEAAGTEVPLSPAETLVGTLVREIERPGKKAQRGFYDYPENAPKLLWPGLAELCPLQEQLEQRELIDRMLFVQALETVRCLEENVVTTVADANIGSIFGWGFAPFSGGTLQFINSWGLPEFTARSVELADRFGDRFKPPALLQRMADEGQSFK